jgi:hypothetical protein
VSLIQNNYADLIAHMSARAEEIMDEHPNCFEESALGGIIIDGLSRVVGQRFTPLMYRL